MAAALRLTCIGSGAGAYLVDAGRPGYRDRGISSGGAADPVSAATVNRLLDQPATHCCLETTLNGGRWLVEGRGQLAVAGADMNWRLNGTPVDHCQVIYLDGCYLLTGGFAHRGCRGYVGLGGHWNLPRILGSVEAGLPGVARIGSGFSVEISDRAETPFRNDWPFEGSATPGRVELRVCTGPEWSLLNARERQWLERTKFTVSSASNRQGIRLCSPTPFPLALPSLISSPVLPGTVQLTPEGPILLGPDAQTVGGYPRVLLAGEFGEAFQLKPGEVLGFRVK
ncbi:allophanate hydrolase subunit 2 [Lewinella aquimaris]|uniref:Allophanate hydrolase subunit 2 n=1 Tax=Neolewinella aquimaris TaxID=1835722 RepID=A0A840E5W4_9BACT|nr:biotin-dependent carboxyltransferase family protein [Neolewinella aquimaris]MBB4081034.1 allophanate hydrolase subunit 2 [Neolewinella aquimaris]